MVPMTRVERRREERIPKRRARRRKAAMMRPLRTAMMGMMKVSDNLLLLLY